jgi:hypothetical protein
MPLFANPEVQNFINNLVGGSTPSSGGGVHGSVSPLAAALAGMSGSPRPEMAPAYQAPPINASFTPKIDKGGGPLRMMEQSVMAVPSIGSSAGGPGAGALASGLGKLGQGIEGSLGHFAARRAKLQDDLLAAHGIASPAPYGMPPKPKPFGSTPDASGDLPSFAQQPGISAGTPSSAPVGGVGIKNQIAQHIVDYARSVGVDPNTALGIAYYEGLNRSNPLATNPDGTIGGVTNTAIGPFQLGTAGLGGQLGVTATTPWKTQVEKAIDYMAAHRTGPWNSVGDYAGTHGNNSNIGPITARGAKIANQLGLTSGASAPATQQPPSAPPPSLPAQTSPGQPQTGPAYSDETWNNRPKFDYGGGQQGMNDQPQFMNPLTLWRWPV